MTGRRKFIGIGAILTGSAILLTKFSLFKSKKKKTARFLTHDGKLVEVELDRIPSKKSSVSKQKLVSWIWKDQRI